MSSDTAELAIADAAGELADGRAPAPYAPVARGARRRRAAGLRWARLRADPARMAAVRDSWRALWISRLLVWVAGVGTVATFGFGPVARRLQPARA